MSAFSFLSTKKRVTELEAENKALTERIALLESAANAESPAIEALKAENKELVEANDGLSKELETAKTAHAEALKANADKIAALEQAQNDFDAKVEKAASAKLLTLSAAAGAPPVTAPTDPKKTEDSKNLTGLERTIAAFKSAKPNHN